MFSSQKEQNMNGKNKNPLLAGLMNVVIPGSSRLYINKDWIGFLGNFLIGIVAFLAAYYLGGLVQDSRTYALPQGLCWGILIPIIVVVLFIIGFKSASDHNNEINSAAFYNAKRTVSHESDQQEYKQIQSMRDDGLISEKEFDEKNAKVASRKK
jgi:hypothetical protein